MARSKKITVQSSPTFRSGHAPTITTKTDTKGAVEPPDETGITGPSIIRPAPTVEQVAEFLGVPLERDAGNFDVTRLRRALPAYVGVLDMCVDHLSAEEADGRFAVRGVHVGEMGELSKSQKRLAALEAVATSVQRAIFVQRAIVDDRAMGLMRKLGRAIKSEESSELELRWKFLLDYLGQFAGGGAPRKLDDGEPVEAPAAPPAPGG